MNEFEVLKKESEKNLILYNKELYDKYYSIFKDLYNQINNLNENSDFDNIKTEYINTFNILKAILNEDNPLQARCVWHRPNEHSTEEIKSFVEWIKSLNFNIIFLEAYYAGRSCYKSEFLEVHPAQKNDKFEGFDDDYLKCLTYFCKLNNIQVHLWNHALNAGGEGLSIPEYIKDNWLLRNYQNKIGHSTCYGDTYYLDPSNTEVLEFVKSIYTEQVSRYDIDGVQLDYIRYYENNYDDYNNIFESGFGEHSEQTFKTKYNLSSDLDIRKEILINQEIKNKFFEFRQNNVYNCVRR
jgi:uncharacterized lipoprotein YddW (UPF0748 family)